MLILLFAPLAAQSASPASRVYVQDDSGRVAVRATRIATPIKVDGKLDEDVYERVPAITQFVQAEPDEGAPVSERTEAWIMFDDKNIYLSCRCWDRTPERI